MSASLTDSWNKLEGETDDAHNPVVGDPMEVLLRAGVVIQQILSSVQDRGVVVLNSHRASAIGMTVGAGMYSLALTATVLVLICMETAHFIHPRREENHPDEE